MEESGGEWRRLEETRGEGGGEGNILCFFFFRRLSQRPSLQKDMHVW